MKKLFRIGPEVHQTSNSSPSAKAPIFSWQPGGNFIATVGSNCVVQIWDRHGDKLKQGDIELEGSAPVTGLEWDCLGESLAVLQQGNGIIFLWDIKDRQISRIDTGLKDPSFLKWSRKGADLAVGTANGNLLIYNKNNRKKIPIMGKHPKKITCGGWSDGNKLALGSIDKQFTISDSEGNTEEQREVKAKPLEIEFASRNSKKHTGETLLSINMGSSLFLYDFKEPESPLELAFQPKYGTIKSHLWFDDEYIMLGFTEGYLVIISTKMQQIGEELYSSHLCRSINDITYSMEMKMAACAGQNGVKVVDFTMGPNSGKDANVTSMNLAGVTEVDWSPDGQILVASTTSGCVHGFLSHMRIVNAHYRSKVACLTSLREVTVFSLEPNESLSPSLSVLTKVATNVEPQFIALGSAHLAVGKNNRINYYRYSSAHRDLRMIDEQQYAGRIETACLNDRFAAVLTGGLITLHEIEAGENGKRRRRNLPDHSEEVEATCIAMSLTMFIFGTSAGSVEFFLLGDDEWTLLPGATLRLDEPCVAKAIYPNTSGTRVVIVDQNSQVTMGNPITSEMTPFPDVPRSTTATPLHVMWDMGAKHQSLIQIWDGKNLHSYVYSGTTRWGPMVSKLGPVTFLPSGELDIVPEPVPMGGTGAQAGGQLSLIFFADGVVTCQDGSGTMETLPVPNFLKGKSDSGSKNAASRDGAMTDRFIRHLALYQLEEAWHLALAINSKSYWLALSNKAIELMDVKMAIRAYREMGNAGMVMAMERLLHMEDKNLLAGSMALLFEDYNKAQELLLASTQPLLALEMRRDLLQWDQALKLAETLAPSLVADIQVQYAKQLEFKGEYSSALTSFEAALERMQWSEASTTNHVGADLGSSSSPGTGRETGSTRKVCVAGIARCTLRLGDIRTGISYVKEENDEELCLECARILEAMKQPNDAAALYELGKDLTKAAAIYIKAPTLTHATRIMSKVTQPKLHIEYAKRCEKENLYEDAAKSFELGRDMDNVVRLCLDHLDQPERASEIVRATSSSTGAQLVALYCQRERNYRGAIEFLLLAQCSEEAFSLARDHDCMDVYTTVLGETMGPDDAANTGSYYEAKHDMGKAGHFYALCGQHAKALKLFLQCGDKEVERAIEVVGKARNDMLTHTLIDFLMGETDGVPKEPFHVYRLYLALGNYAQAAKTALIIARQEQDGGNYFQAHNILHETIRQLGEQRTRVPLSLRRPFTLLHSYLLVKKRIARDDHAGAARLLLRVAKSISKFPAHMVIILTSTVIESARAGLKKSALEYATVLMRQEYRAQVDSKFKRKIEGLVRRPNREELPEPVSECPVSGILIPVSCLECPTTKDALPMCIVTGQHIVKDDCCICPNSLMPAIYSEYVKFLEFEDNKAGRGGSNGEYLGPDPVTGKPVNSKDLQKLAAEEVADLVERYNQSKELKEKNTKT